MTTRLVIWFPVVGRCSATTSLPKLMWDRLVRSIISALLCARTRPGGKLSAKSSICQTFTITRCVALQCGHSAQWMAWLATKKKKEYKSRCGCFEHRGSLLVQDIVGKWALIKQKKKKRYRREFNFCLFIFALLTKMDSERIYNLFTIPVSSSRAIVKD